MKLQDVLGFKTIALASLTVVVLGMLLGKTDLDNKLFLNPLDSNLLKRDYFTYIILYYYNTHAIIVVW